MRFQRFIYGAIIIILVSACKNKTDKLFSSLPASQTGINFQNNITETDSFNILDYLYFYNGGGVAIGDINNDGLEDVYFTSNQGSNKLYLNKGNFHFEDITDKAGVRGKGNWKTGVTMADVNGDGWLDIYVCEVGKYKSLHGKNELFINNGPSPLSSRKGAGGEVTFTEKAKEYGLDVEGFNTQAAFFDYDKDGDLDMFLVNHSVHSTDTYVDASERKKKNDVSGDKLFRCDFSSSTGGDKGEAVHFIEVTEQAGIYSSIIGYGLNVITGDFNNDNWEDIYVSNDFHENDYYYVNNRNGTFTEMNQQAFGHESRFSMGSDAGDINNDGWLDLITLDMLPADEKVLKSSVTDDALDIYDFKTGMGYHHQYSKNCLQLNTGGGKKFSDISLYAGVAATDWSWSPLLADFDNDGIKDLFVANGILRRPNDLDYLKFTSNRFVAADLQKGKSVDKIVIEQMPEGKIPNYIFKGTSDLKFIDQSKTWGFDLPFYSNGAAYADLDNDGDVDLVINHINAPAGIYKNNSNTQLKNNYLSLQLKAKGNNKFSYGAKAVIITKDGLNINYVSATKGFESSSSPVLHFGLGDIKLVDTLQIIWPDGTMQNFVNVKVNQRLIIKQAIVERTKFLLPDSSSFIPLFKDYTDSIRLEYKHEENRFVDFNAQPLIPHEVSTQGPKLAVADINDDGLDDFFVCGARAQAGKLFQQTSTGNFVSTNELLFAADEFCEDVNAVFFDADGDKDKDLYVVSGGNQIAGNDSSLLDRLYLNDGKGNFLKALIPSIYENKSVAVPADVDHDGDMDLFVGGRVVTNEYGKIPQSLLLLNNGKAQFSIAPDNTCPGLRNIGMVTSAVWTDIDRDGWNDLVIAGEWMPITVYKNEKGRLRNATNEYGLGETTGLWSSLISADINNDGYEDLLAGNWGKNTKLQTSVKFPLQMYVGDIDGNGIKEQILCIAKDGAYYTFLGKEEIEKLIPGVIRKRFLDYKTMAGKTIEEVLGDKLSSLKKLSVNTLSSLLIKNNSGKLIASELPAASQWSPVFSFITGDFNKDGKTDILSAGNFYGVLPYEGRYDAGNESILLRNDSSFKNIYPMQCGLLLNGEIRDIKKIRTRNLELYIFARNNNNLLFYKN